MGQYGLVCLRTATLTKHLTIETLSNYMSKEYGPTIFRKIGAPTNWVYNALAYNPLDGYLYGISRGRIKMLRSISSRSTYDEDPSYPAGHLLKISPVNGTVEDIGPITGIQSQRADTWPNDLWGGITSGVIMADATYAFSNSSQSGTHNLYILDLSKLANRTARRFMNTNLQSNDYTYSEDASIRRCFQWIYTESVTVAMY